MDVWGIGCVFFEVLGLAPLFPGKDELDQVHLIHNVLGTPDKKLLDLFQKRATHMEFNFPDRKYSGISKLIPHVSQEIQELILNMIKYNPDERITAARCLENNIFKELKDQEREIAPAILNSPFNNTSMNLNAFKSMYSEHSKGAGSSRR
jgi:renal tumor antigen